MLYYQNIKLYYIIRISNYIIRRLFSAAQVPQTNLILLAVDGSCDCDVITKVSIEPIEIAGWCLYNNLYNINVLHN